MFSYRSLYLRFLEQVTRICNGSDRLATGLQSLPQGGEVLHSGKRKPAVTHGGMGAKHQKRVQGADHFCHVRFLWRFDFKRFLRLCLFIFNRRFFFRLPMVF